MENRINIRITNFDVVVLGEEIMNEVPKLRLSQRSKIKKHEGTGMNGAQQSPWPAEIFFILFLSKKRIKDK